jgi:hypothetical protein
MKRSERIYRHHCDSCQAMMINGVFCHEQGCPDAWKSYSRECEWCGQPFNPEKKYQKCCCDSCTEDFYG